MVCKVFAIFGMIAGEKGLSCCGSGERGSDDNLKVENVGDYS